MWYDNSVHWIATYHCRVHRGHCSSYYPPNILRWFQYGTNQNQLFSSKHPPLSQQYHYLGHFYTRKYKIVLGSIGISTGYYTQNTLRYVCTSKSSSASASKIKRKQEWERERERATLRRKDRPQQTAKREKKELIPSILGYNSGQPKATANLSGRSELSETRRRNKIRTATMHDNTITNLISFPMVPHILSHLLAPQFFTIVYDYMLSRVL